MTVNGNMRNGTSFNDVDAMELHLRIGDSDLREELAGYEAGDKRNEFAISALKIGVIALRQAQGRIDADRVRQEGERFIKDMGYALDKHQNEVTGQITSCLKVYFDPDNGSFNERVKRLVEKDGDLEQVIRGQIADDGSELARTLTTHVGKGSLLMQTLDPNASDGLINRLTQSTEQTLSTQKEAILGQFSLDNPGSALSRLVSELTKNHGEVGDALENRIGEVVSEFSLDNDNSALSRLVKQVDTAQRKISNEFSLDEEGSALARMQKNLLAVLDGQQETNARFQEEVKTTLAEMNARKKEAERSTRHGEVFEDAVFSFVSDLRQNSGDVATRTGNTTGRIKNNKKGDVVIQLGPEHVAAEAKIVIEAKANASYTIEGALAELNEAKKNRDAGIGLFVFSSKSAPAGLEAFNRYGDNLVVVWDAEDAASDVYFDAGLSVAKALCVRSKTRSEEVGADIDAIERAVLEIEKQAGGLEEITKSANTIRRNNDTILNRARIMGEALSKQIGILNENVDALH